ncbi:MAG: hypothetical protein IKZ88_06690 [Neisseriaceae bacterium]|nr:hypothetical protein [Neisseriaceae bacterium]
MGQYNPPQRREKLITHCFLWIFRPIGRMVGWKTHPITIVFIVCKTYTVTECYHFVFVWVVYIFQ